MTDKQIIIDGIDVSGCPHLIEDYKWWNIAGQEEHDINICALSFDDYRDFEEDDFCKENPNCYYKQLKRKEQECENNKIAYKIELDIYNQECFNLQEELKETFEQLDQLKAENDYLKHKIFRYEEIFKHSADIIKNPVTAIEVETFHSGVKALGNSLIAEENNKLHKTLTEIKEIAEKRNYLDYNECLDDILQKISECEGDKC